MEMDKIEVDKQVIDKIGDILCDQNRPLKERFRALFTLRNLSGEHAVKNISRVFSDDSALLKHECAYCLGQMQNVSALPILKSVLQDKSQDPMVRHEAGEALGAIGSADSLAVLQKYIDDPEVVVSETCNLALQRINWLLTESKDGNSASKYFGVDPTPAAEKSSDISDLENKLLDDKDELFNRYKAMFALRNDGSTDAVLGLCKGLKAGSALYRHEIAFVLGQMQNEASVASLIESLKDPNEHEMVRHECAEALGSIATDACMETLKEFLSDPSQVVRESCEVALDMCEYENNKEFQYADSLIKTKS